MKVVLGADGGGAGLLAAVGAGTIPDWIVAITAVVGTCFAIWQLRTVAHANRGQTSTVRAQLMLEIDARFESKEMLESRLAIRTLRNHCERKAKKSLRSGANDGELFATSASLFSRELSELFERFKTADQIDSSIDELANQPDDAEGSRYFTLMRLPYWAETVASLTRDKLMPIDDVLNLYDAIFTETLTCFMEHIHDRRSQPPKRNDRFLEHAQWLKEVADQRDTQRAADARAAEDNHRQRRFGIF